MSRKPCIDCVRKHIAQAAVLLDETHLGYPHHRWLAVGHLAEAESECLGEFPEFAQKIRDCRLEIMKSHERSKNPCLEELLIEACQVGGEADDLQYDDNSSKIFDTVQ